MDFERHLLIDAYNVIYQWPDLRRLLPARQAAARERLAVTVRPIHDWEKIRVTLVYDGQGQDIEIERPTGQTTFSMIFSPATMSADDVIERLIGASANSEQCMVVTRDAAQRTTVEALGASSITPEQLREWVDRTERAISADIAARRRQVEREWKSNEKGLP